MPEAKVSPSDDAEDDFNDNDPKKGVPKMKVKENLLLKMQTEPFADDTDLYQPRIDRKIRLRYFVDILSQGRVKYKQPVGFSPLIQEKKSDKLQLSDFPRRLVFLLDVVKSARWDHWYLDLMVVFLLLVVYFDDGYSATYGSSLPLPPSILVLPLVGMFVCQLIPVFGAVYFTVFCNDLIRLRAQNDFGRWAFGMVLVSQIMEYFCFGGCGRVGRSCRLPSKKKPNAKVVSANDNDNDNDDASGGDGDGDDMQDASTIASVPADQLPPLNGPNNIDGDNNNGANDSNNKPQSENNEPDEPNNNNNNNNNSTASLLKDKKPPPLFSPDVDRELDKRLLAEEAAAVMAREAALRAQKEAAERALKAAAEAAALAAKEAALAAEKSKKAKKRKEGKGPAPVEASMKSNNPTNDIEAQLAETGPIGSSANNPETVLEEITDIEAPPVAVEWMEWRCVTCNHQNKRRRHPTRNPEVYFDTTGQYYKRTIAIVRTRRDMPQCIRCFTDADYKPPRGSAHLFPHYANPTAAFGNYPIETRVHAGLGSSKVLRFLFDIRSLIIGLRDDHDSLLAYNDWRLRKFLASKFPQMPRQIKAEDEFYEVGEILECRQQKSHWNRCRVVNVRESHTYDIRYDPGDELRYVAETALRLPPQKGSYAYRVELAMVLLALLLPLFLLMAVSSGKGGESVAVFPIIICIAPLAIERVFTLFKYFIDFSLAGFVMIFRLFVLLSLPLLLLLMSALQVLQGGSHWGTAASLFIAAEAASLPLLYIMRAAFAAFGLPVLLCAGVGAVFVAGCLEGQCVVGSTAATLAPWIVTVLMAKYLRYHLHAFWDVCLKIRPPRQFDTRNPTVVERFVDACRQLTM